MNKNVNKNIGKSRFISKNAIAINDGGQGNDNLRIAVVAHVYYLEIAPEILIYLSHIPVKYRLYITVSANKSEELIKLLKDKKLDDYEIIIYPNQGYDIAPFLHVLHLIKDKNYDLVCKIHTKKGPKNKDDSFGDWFEQLMSPILGTKSIVKNILNGFIKNKDLGMVGSADFYKSAQGLMYGNEAHVEKLLSAIDVGVDPSKEWGFFAGTIFWARVSIFSSMLNNSDLDNLINKDIHINMEAGAPVSVFHALERVFGLLPGIMNMKTGISHQLGRIRGAPSFQLLSDNFKPSSKSIHETLVCKKRKPCIVVLGMHRSGTSVLSGITSFFGFSPGTDLMAPTKDNPKGYFENNKVVRLNDKIFEDHFSSWRDYTFNVDEINAVKWREYVEKAKQIILEEADEALSLLKDPRLCLLFPIWEQAFEELNIPLNILIVYRDPLEVAHSLYIRSNFDNLDYEHSYLLWAHSLFQLELSSRRHPRLFINYTKDFRDIKKLLNRLGGFTGQKVTEKIQQDAEKFYAPSLNHHEKTLGTQLNIPSSLEQFRRVLEQTGIISTKKIDALRNDYYSSLKYVEYFKRSHIKKIQKFVDDLDEKKKGLLKMKADYSLIESKNNEFNTHLSNVSINLEIERKKSRSYQKKIQKLKKRLKKMEDEFPKEKHILEIKLEQMIAPLKKREFELTEEKRQLEKRLQKLSETLIQKEGLLSNHKLILEEELERFNVSLKKKDERFLIETGKLKKDLDNVTRIVIEKESLIGDLNTKMDIASQVFGKLLSNPSYVDRIRNNINGPKGVQKIKKFILNKQERKIFKEKEIIGKTELFSPFYYLIHNADIVKAGVEPLGHFCRYGWKEKRNPSPLFNVDGYLRGNQDVDKSGMNPLIHYIIYGKKEGRSTYSQIECKKQEVEIGKKIVSIDRCDELKELVKERTLPEIDISDNGIQVSIIVLNRDGIDYLKTLIPAIYNNTKGIKYELIVVDNASSDDSVNYLENCKYDIKLKIIKNKINETFSKGNNLAAKQAEGQYLVLLNNDVEPLYGWLHFLLDSIKHEKNAGSVGARLVYPFKKGFGSSCSIQHSGISFQDEIDYLRPYNQGNGKSVNDPFVLQSGAKSALTAACLLVPKEIYQKVEGLDEKYNYGSEDVDFGLKLLMAGYTNYYCADAVLFHYEFGTQDKNNSVANKTRRNINASIMRNKWFSYLKQRYWKEKLYCDTHLVAESPLKIAIAVTDHGPNVTAGDYFTAQELALAFERIGWEVVFLSRKQRQWYDIPKDVNVLLSLLDAYDLRKHPKRETRLFTIAWVRNWFDRWCDKPYFNSYDMVFASSEKSCDYLRNNSNQEPILLPIANNPERFAEKPECATPESLESDICFTGSYWNSPRDIMQSLSDHALKTYCFHVYGANWEKFDRFKPYSKGFIAYQDMPCVYHHTKIVLDDANHVTKPYGSVNSRVFDALVSGALVITNGVEGSKELFEGKLPYYESSAQLDELLDFYLNNEVARLAKVEELRQIILAKHTYAHRAKTFRESLSSRFLSPSIAIKIPCPTWEGAHSWGDYHMAILLREQLEKEGYRVILQILPEWDNKEGKECDVALVLRGLSRYMPKSHQINIMWNISHPDKVTLEEYEEYDQVFIASDYWAKEISKQVSVPVESMLQCTDPKRFREPNDEEKERYRRQLLFVGNSRKIYRKILKDLLPTKYDLAVYGSLWHGLIPDHYWNGTYIDNILLHKYYGAADILLNDHWEDMREKGFVSNRIFDGLACGAFIITDRVQAMGELEDYVQVYDASEDLNELISYYLCNPDERRKKALLGMEYVKKNHTFEERAKLFSKTIKHIALNKNINILL